MSRHVQTANHNVSFSTAFIVCVLTLSSLSTADAEWLRGWVSDAGTNALNSSRGCLQGFRQLKEVEPERQNTSSLNLSCTWSDVDGCYLDYFDHLPPTEIRDYYRIDEV